MADREKKEVPTLSEFAFLILVSLAGAGQDGRHGYGIIKDIEEMTAGRRVYAVPSLYEALRTLQTQGLVEPAGESIVNGRLRKHYRITGAGELAARRHEAEQEQMQQGIRAWVGRNSKLAAGQAS